MKRGKFIVLYGINNLGKSTQAKLLVERLKRGGHKAEYLKYPLYDLSPSGPLINDYLRKGNPLNLTPGQIQIIYVLNRTQFQSVLKEKLASGTNVIAEDYIGTGIAWGIGAGVAEIFLKQLNKHLLKEDLAFLFEGQRFTEGIEDNHQHEQDNELTEKVRLAHDKLGQEFGWLKINANQKIEIIGEEIWREVSKIL